MAFSLHELGNTYADAQDRYVVSLIITYADADAASPEEAVAHALDLTRDDNSYDTHWYVFDRHTQTLHLIEQGAAEALTTWP